jgi:hypothetical protein
MAYCQHNACYLNEVVRRVTSFFKAVHIARIVILFMIVAARRLLKTLTNSCSPRWPQTKNLHFLRPWTDKWNLFDPSRWIFVAHLLFIYMSFLFNLIMLFEDFRSALKVPVINGDFSGVPQCPVYFSPR